MQSEGHLGRQQMGKKIMCWRGNNCHLLTVMKRNKRFRFVIKTDIGGQGHILLNTVPVVKNMFGSWIYKFSLRVFAFN